MDTRSIVSRVSTAVTVLGGFVLLAGCGTADAGRSLATRETLANGAVMVTYSALPALPVDSLIPNIRIGKVDGEPWETFGQIRALEAGPDGTIYVLDYQASEVRAFDATGAFVATLARRGQGPGEIRQANGMVLASDGTLWVQDHSARAIVGLAADGREVARHPMLVSGYGFEWGAAIDGSGVIRQTWNHSDRTPGAPRVFGYLEGRSRSYLKSYDLGTRAYDSIYLGEQLRPYLSIDNGDRSYTNTAAPFSPQGLSVIDRLGSIWVASSNDYRITRIDTPADTALIIDVPLVGPLITGEERSSAERLFERAGATPSIPERKPVLSRLLTDDEGRLWVERALVPDQPRHLDAFDREGEFLGSMTLPINTNYLTPVIRDGHIYAVVLDELDVSYVIRAPLPAFAR
jgi:hypothetical protein